MVVKQLDTWGPVLIALVPCRDCNVYLDTQSPFCVLPIVSQYVHKWLKIPPSVHLFGWFNGHSHSFLQNMFIIIYQLQGP